MNQFKFRNFQPEDEPSMIELQHRCVENCPDSGKFESGMWLSPAYKNGKNIFIAEGKSAQILGYAATCSAYYSNKLEARIYWMDLRIDPDIEQHSEIKDSLLEMVIQRGCVIKMAENRERAAIGATYFSQGQASIDYLKSRGFIHFESMLAMRRELSLPILTFEPPGEIQIKSWKMESQEEKVAYLAARETAFGYPLGRLDLLEHFTGSSLWQDGTSFTAFFGGKIIGSVMALSNGLLDFVFVVPEWRGKGIAKAIITEALKFLQNRKHVQAWLEVYSHNQAAVSLYQGFGFEAFKEEISLGYLLDGSAS